MELFVFTDIQPGEITLPPEESHHISKVLRFNPGEQLYLTDGMGTLARGQITHVHHRNTVVHIIDVVRQPRSLPHVHLYVSPTRTTDRTEWLVEKATELGVKSLNFIYCERTARKNINLDRYMKIARAAAKQSLNCYFPEIKVMPDIRQALLTSPGEKLLATCIRNQRLPPTLWSKGLKEYSLFIGPEGDFTNSETELATDAGCRLVELGSLRLRTETAAIAGISILKLSFQGNKERLIIK